MHMGPRHIRDIIKAHHSEAIRIQWPTGLSPTPQKDSQDMCSMDTKHINSSKDISTQTGQCSRSLH
jgi:hypothetical protein